MHTLWPGSDDLLRRWEPFLSRKLLNFLGSDAFILSVGQVESSIEVVG